MVKIIEGRGGEEYLISLVDVVPTAVATGVNMESNSLKGVLFSECHLGTWGLGHHSTEVVHHKKFDIFL